MSPCQGWPGEVGFVTEPLRRLPLDPSDTTAFLCGPEPMMRNSAQRAPGKGMAASDIRVSSNATCNAGSAGADTASSVRCCCAATARSSATTLAEPLLRSRSCR